MERENKQIGSRNSSLNLRAGKLQYARRCHSHSCSVGPMYPYGLYKGPKGGFLYGTFRAQVYTTHGYMDP